MRRLLPLPLLALTLMGCPSYDNYAPRGLAEGAGAARPVCPLRPRTGRRRSPSRGSSAYAYQGDTPADYGAQAAAGVAYARTMPDVVNVTPDSLGHRLTIQFKSGWRTAVDPIADGRRGSETPGVPAATPAS